MIKDSFVVSLATLFLLINAFGCINAVEPLKKSSNEGEKLSYRVSEDPDANLDPLQMIEKAGFPAENHTVTTEDGYILTMHRIPCAPTTDKNDCNKQDTVILQHGLLGSSADWLITGKYKALAYILSESGYDIWMPNFRGSTWSKGHVKWNISDSNYWNFSWDQMGMYDLPAIISYISNFKNSKVLYIGHSMGTTTSFVMAIRRPDIAEKIIGMISLAPVAYLTHMTSPLKYIAPFVNDFEFIAHFLGLNQFLPQNELIKLLARFGCDKFAVEKEICSNFMFVITGFDKREFNETLLPAILAHTPAGTSTKTVVHYCQEKASGKFRQFDYGKKGNLKHYNSTTPPEYDLRKMNIPTAFIYAENDWLTNPKDVEMFYQLLPKKSGLFKVNLTEFNHVDFLYAIDAPALVYKEVIYLLFNFTYSP